MDKVMTPTLVSVRPGMGQNRTSDKKLAKPNRQSTLKRPYRSASGAEPMRPSMLAAFMIATMCVAMEGVKPTFFAYEAMVKKGTKKLMNSTATPMTKGLYALRSS